MRTRTEGFDRIYQTYPQLVAMVGARHGGRTNIMPAVWNTQVSFDPPLYAVAVASQRFTHGLIAGSRAFSLSFFPLELLDTLHAAGKTSGREIEKIATLGIRVGEGVRTPSPVLLDAYACLECDLRDARDYGDHTLFVGEVRAVHWDESVMDEKGLLRVDRVSPILYLGSNNYVTADRTWRAVRPSKVALPPSAVRTPSAPPSV